MYKVPDDLLKEIKLNLKVLIKELWLASELEEEEFKKDKKIARAAQLLKLIEDNYDV